MFAKIRLMKRFAALIVYFPMICGVAIAQPTSADLRQILETIERRDYGAAVAELRQMQSDDARGFSQMDHDYLLARIAEKENLPAIAMANYQSVVNRGSVLKPYALSHLSQIARSTGNLLLESIYLSELARSAPNHFLAKGAILRSAQNRFESGFLSETIRILSGPAAALKSLKPRENRALLAQAYLYSGQLDEAREIFDDLLRNTSNPEQPDDAALIAVKELDLLDVGSENYETSAPKLEEAEHVLRAKVYQFNREFATARLHYEAVMANYPAGVWAAEAGFQIGRGFSQTGQHVEALKWFERVVEQYRENSTAKDALLNAASAYSRVGKPREAILRYENYIGTYPSEPSVDRAYLNIIDVLRDQGDDAGALKWCAKTREVFQGKLPETQAWFAEARIYI
ncbi:MAG: tol-pal system YbgF family protein, partial [Pyrinomonadaceae bacterium]